MTTAREHGVRGWAWRAIARLRHHRELAGSLLLGRGRAPQFSAFRDAGLVHLLAVSGLHLGLALAGVMLLARALGLGWVGRQLLLLAAAIAYLWLTGGSLPTQRATAMVVALVAAALCARQVHPLAPVSLAALALTLWQPAQARSPGFQLSVAAVLGIVTLGRDLMQHRRRVWPLRPLPLDTRTWRALLATGRWAIDGLAVGVAASLAVLPIIALRFGVLHLWAPVATLLAAPFLIVVLGPGLLLLVLAGVWTDGPWEGLYRVVEWGLGGLDSVVAWTATWPGASLSATAAPWWLLLLWPFLFRPLRDHWDALLRGGAVLVGVLVLHGAIG